MRRWTIILVAVYICLSSVCLQAAPLATDYGPFTVTFYNNDDTDDNYTGQKDWTVQERADVAAAIDGWDQFITNTPGRQIDLHIFWYEFVTGGVLGGSYSPSNGDGTTSWTYPEHIWRDAVDYNGPWDGWDTTIRLDITAGGVSWNLGSDNPAAGEIDFRSVLTHEIGHSLGFVDTYSTVPFDD